jgi:hypothetical protein
MGIMQSETSFSGRLGVRKIPGTVEPPFFWKLKNRLHPRFWFNWFCWNLARWFTNVTGIATATGSLRLIKIKANGQRVNYGRVAYGLVTTAFVNFMVDQLQTETSVFGDFKYHDSGVGTTGAAVGDTDIETTDGESRATGTQAEGVSANIYRSVGTISYTSTLAITEHGLFNASTSGTLMDRHVFSAVNVVNGDSIEFTYELTVNAGG